MEGILPLVALTGGLFYLSRKNREQFLNMYPKIIEKFQKGSLPSILEYKPGYTQSTFIIQNFNPFNYDSMFPVFVLAPVGQGPWGTSWGGGQIPPSSGAQWIWDNPHAITNEHRHNTISFFYIYNNTTNEPINVTLVIYADNRCSAVLVNNQMIGYSFDNQGSFYITLARGDNKIQINAENFGGPAGIAVQCKNDSQTLFVSNREWKTPFAPPPQPPPPPPPPPPPKVFRKSSETNPNCCGGGGGDAREMICPEGAYVNAFFGGAGSLIDSIGIQCSNKIKFGPHGGGGGSPYAVYTENGFNKLGVRTGALVDQIKFFSENKDLRTVGGGGGDPHELNCGDGKIMGLKVRTGALVDRIQAVCGKEQ